MATLLKLGPADHGRTMSWDEYISGDYEQGYRYELIAGRLYVSPWANLPETTIVQWLVEELKAYARANPKAINYVTAPARVFVPDAAEGEVTAPEPDAVAYRDFPFHVPVAERDWRDISPILVVEVLVDAAPEKDLVRNVNLYFRVPSVREYWVLDGREDAGRPSLVARRRYGSRWVVREVPHGGTYATKTLPGFELKLDPIP